MPDTVHELDIRTLPTAERHTEVFRAFDALETGGGFVLVNDHYPRGLLRQFQAERHGDFEWSVLENGPARFRIEIRRRAGEPSRCVSEYLEYDHRRLDEILPDVRQLAGAGDFGTAAQRFAEFFCGLSRHIDAEEQILFPSFEQLTGITGGPTVVMRAEHVEIRREMSAIAEALDTRDGDAFASALGRMTGVLIDHNMKEEAILYPMTDRSADDRERDDLVRQMQAL